MQRYKFCSIILALTFSVCVRAYESEPDSALGERIPPRADFRPIAAGNGYSLAVAPDGSVWSWGNNSGGLTGNQSTPVKIDGLTDIVSVAAGGTRNLALASDGSVWAWGGLASPARLEALTDVAAIAAGYDLNLALKRDGTVWQWGVGSESEPVLIRGLSNMVGIAAGGGCCWAGDHMAAVRADGSVWVWASDEEAIIPKPWPYQVPGLTGAISAEAMLYDSVILTGDGTLRRLGYSAQFTGITGLSEIASIAASGDLILSLKRDGTVWGTGCLGCGWMGGGVVVYENLYGPDPSQISGLPGIAAIATSDDHGLALGEDGTLWAWGSNRYGGLGDGTTVDRTTPVRVSGLPSLAPRVGAVVNAASFNSGPLASGEIVSLFGVGMGPRQGVQAVADTKNVLPTLLAHTRVLFDGVQGTILFSHHGQVNAIAPSFPATATSIVLEQSSVRSAPLIVATAESAPGIFSLNYSGIGQAVALNEDGGINTPDKPASRA